MAQRGLVEVVQYLKVLAHETRLRLLGLLGDRERSVGELAEILGLKEPTISHHLARLAEGGLVAMRPEGTVHFYSLNGEALELSAREISLLEVFLQRAGRLVSKDQLVSHLCEWGEEVSPNAIEVYVHRLRKKLEPGGVRILTVRGVGYSLEKPPA